MYKVLLLPLAKLDIGESAKWYENRQKGLGKKFVQEIRIKMDVIRKNPKAFAVRYKKVRTAVLNIFPYIIHYTVEEKQKTIIVSAVLHTSRNSEIWKKR